MQMQASSAEMKAVAYRSSRGEKVNARVVDYALEIA